MEAFQERVPDETALVLLYFAEKGVDTLQFCLPPPGNTDHTQFDTFTETIECLLQNCFALYDASGHPFEDTDVTAIRNEEGLWLCLFRFGFHRHLDILVRLGNEPFRVRVECHHRESEVTLFRLKLYRQHG